MNQRFYSLDIFRGATVALMILVNNPGSWGHIYPPLEHASWHGVTPTDLVFPFFLFAVGNAMAFVLPRLEAAGEKVFWTKVLRRTALIFLIGLFLNWFPFIKYSNDALVPKPYAALRIMGVLQRIALAYGFAAIIVHLAKWKGARIISIALLLGYWLLCLATNPADPYSISGWFGTAVDKAILGESHMYHGEGIAFDPEGLMSLPAAIVQVIIGFMVGDYIRRKGKTQEMLNGLFVAGLAMVFVGFAWDLFFPINKKIWTSSYTVYTSGLAMLVLGFLIWLVEFNNKRGRWSRFFDVFGKNALFIFVLSGVFPRTMALIRIPNGVNDAGKQSYLSPLSWFYEKICKPLFEDPRNASLLYAICFIIFMWFLAWLMDRKKWYVRV